MQKFGAFSTVIPKIIMLEFITFAKMGKNYQLAPNISEYARPILSKFAVLVDVWVGYD